MTDNTTPLELAVEIATRHNLLWRDVCGPGSTSEIMACRRDIARELKARRYSTLAIARMLNKSRGAIVYYLKDRTAPSTLTANVPMRPEWLRTIAKAASSIRFTANNWEWMSATAKAESHSIADTLTEIESAFT